MPVINNKYLQLFHLRMFIQLNNNQYQIPRDQLIKLKIDGVVNCRTIVVARALIFKCGSDLVYTDGGSWLVLGKIMGKDVGRKWLCCKIKRRKGYKRTYGFRNVITMVYFTKIVKDDK
ncbi:50S ribosomal protein L21 [Candidatus Hodgkinia cicadicola]|uniref:50S ribosomal protein L21 n=1 Tax=Candidatus Hodgkinia cicadicola TaxID=573658 RepID=A0ABX4MHA8_9HYPH|nr:50S ribosomal protein L21 [Candidatus Hodgkinia cicadicola]